MLTNILLCKLLPHLSLSFSLSLSLSLSLLKIAITIVVAVKVPLMIAYFNFWQFQWKTKVYIKGVTLCDELVIRCKVSAMNFPAMSRLAARIPFNENVYDVIIKRWNCHYKIASMKCRRWNYSKSFRRILHWQWSYSLVA